MTDHEAVFSYFTEEARTLAGAALRSVTVYGSSVTDQFRDGKSDYNFLVVADAIDMDLLDRLGARMGKWRKKRIAPPLVVSPSFVARAIDSYPLEFLSMKAHYRVLFGEDVLKDLAIGREHVRLQCERELWSKLLLFRRAYLESEGAPRRLQHLVERGLPSLVAIFRGMLFLKDGPWTATGPELWKACTERLGLSGEFLAELHAVRGRRSAPARQEIRAHLAQVLRDVEKLALEVDQW